MKNFVLCMLLVGVPMGAQAQKKPTYEEARALYDRFQTTINATSLWHKKSLQERLQMAQAADALTEKAGRTLGVGSFCHKTAIYHQDYVKNLNSLTLVLEGRRQISTPSELFQPMLGAEQLGNLRAACYEEVEALDTPQARK